jgi:hypothetical protein
MATISASWTENQSLQGAQTLNASSSDTDDIDLDTNGYVAVLIQWKGTFHGSATEGCTIEVFGSSDSGTSDDTIALCSRKVAVDAGNTVTVSILIENVPYIAVKRTNNDGSHSITNETVVYAGLKYST